MIIIRSSRKIAEKELNFRNSLWLEAPDIIWDRRSAKGFATIPKTFPLISRIMDELAEVPVSPAYLTLWCQTWDNGFARLTNVADLAYATGFTGQRGERTFRERVRRLADLGFIKVSPSGSELLGYVLIVNPHAVILSHWTNKTAGMREASYNALISRAHDVGCQDVMALLKPKPPQEAKPVVKVKSKPRNKAAPKRKPRQE